jgi:L,D-transpeptidase catalytic domain
VRATRGTTLVAVLAAALLGASSARAAAARPQAPTPRAAWIAHIVTPTPGWSAPGGGRRRLTISPLARWDHGPVALLVLGARRVSDGTTWLRVLLAQRPNGTSVWIDADLARLTRTPWRIDVSLPGRTVSLLRAGRARYRWRAVVGKPSTPTPTGLFSVYQRVRQPGPDDFLGTWALLLSGSPTRCASSTVAPDGWRSTVEVAPACSIRSGARDRTAASGSTTPPSTCWRPTPSRALRCRFAEAPGGPAPARG